MILYTKKVCPKCKFVKRELEVRGIQFEVINIDETIEARETLKANGFTQAPIVKVEGKYLTELSEIVDYIESKEEQSE